VGGDVKGVYFYGGLSIKIEGTPSCSVLFPHGLKVTSKAAWGIYSYALFCMIIFFYLPAVTVPSSSAF